jgi:hypothetical protein
MYHLKGKPFGAGPGREGLLVLLALPRRQREFDELSGFPACSGNSRLRPAVRHKFFIRFARALVSPGSIRFTRAIVTRVSAARRAVYAIKKITAPSLRHCRSLAYVEVIIEAAAVYATILYPCTSILCKCYHFETCSTLAGIRAGIFTRYS